ncbi:hypothetical protein CDAR_495951 [Caerostris darwini]|uniref:Reverse transcriptase RNase H-like domain-containing protein n=1 Tax=Caerostris darwini TaxID=1538125 RepID=A0AAV4U1P1_9ARAC|nr:hypothetical protein CDAR_377301 [Caerostris darwini]GIY51696.1 hypothetical protein CDAR_495951 [Caerostris darwini]
MAENNDKNQPPSQRRDRKPLKYFYCGRLGHIASECERKRRRSESGFQHPISFTSRKLGTIEVKYSVVEKVALGVVFGINHFKNYLYGSHFIVY